MTATDERVATDDRAATDHAVLRRLRAALDAQYGERLERVVLFGSRARGDARVDSDYDVAVFIRDRRSFGEENIVLSEIVSDILWDTGTFISALPMHAGSYAERTGLMHELRKDGIDF